ncbi:hypothetical protein T492DRAFT_427597 [Pavlovales sp. CCMP2436]|nr:hypothetical protein T492DRAFT_427597 [Pavlovales sp. CCMP2436]
MKFEILNRYNYMQPIISFFLHLKYSQPATQLWWVQRDFITLVVLFFSRNVSFYNLIVVRRCQQQQQPCLLTAFHSDSSVLLLLLILLLVRRVMTALAAAAAASPSPLPSTLTQLFLFSAPTTAVSCVLFFSSVPLLCTHHSCVARSILLI